MGLFSRFCVPALFPTRPGRWSTWSCRPGGQMRIRRHDVAGEPKRRQHADGEPGVVDFPSVMAVAGRAPVGMMVVVPALAVGDQAEYDVVAAVLVGLVV